VPKRSHDEYSNLSSSLRKTVRTLSSILRVAESLDRSHAQAITGLELRDRGEDYLLLVHTGSDAELEVWATNRHLQPFEKLVGKPVRLESATVAVQPSVPAVPAERRKHRRAKPMGTKPKGNARPASP
jgi:exopolyphosphatase/guanosine-5'-triphosphate,3'-diphosphate pyrophosphatase